MRKNSLTVALVLGSLGLRLWLAGVPNPANFDDSSFDTVARIMRHGGNVYAETPFYNYGPVWMYVLWGLSYVADACHVHLFTAIRGFLTVVDFGVALVIAQIAIFAGYDGRRALLAYLLCPVVILTTGLHGQFEALASLPLLGAAWLALRPKGGSSWAIWLLGSLSLIINHIVVFSTWTLFDSVFTLRRAAILMFAAITVFAASFLPFWSVGHVGIVHNVLGYGTQPGWFGVGLLNETLSYPFFIATMALLPMLLRGRSLVDRLELSAVAFVVLTPGFGSQYLMLPAVFGSIRASRWYLYYGLSGAVTWVAWFFKYFPPYIHVAPQFFEVALNLTWVLTLAWLIARLVVIHVSARATRISSVPSQVSIP